MAKYKYGRLDILANNADTTYANKVWIVPPID